MIIRHSKKNWLAIAGLLALLLAFSMVTTPLAMAQNIEAIYFISADPQRPSNVRGAVIGGAGAVTYYYWVVARYNGGSVVGIGPAKIASAPAVTTPANYVQIFWDGVIGVNVTYDLLRTTFAGWPNGIVTCAACLVHTGITTTASTDTGAPALGAYTMGPFNYPHALASIMINNRDYTLPSLVFSAPTPLATITNNAEVDVSGPNLDYLSMSGRTGSVQGFGSRIEANFATVTGLKGADFRARSVGGAAGTVIGVQASGTTSTGTVTMDELYGANFNANHSVGAVTNVYGMAAAANIVAAATAPSQYAFGVLGVMNSDKNLAALPLKGAVVAVVKYGAVTANLDGAFVASRDGGGAAGTDNAAYRYKQLASDSIPAFNYGLDLYPGATASATPLGIADLRGSMQSLLNNETAFKWTSNSEVQVSGAALAALDWSTRAGSVQGVGSRISANMATVTALKGADFRATSLGGGGTYVIGTQSSGNTGAGTATVTELYGGNFLANHNTGAVAQMYGAAGVLTIGAGATSSGWFANGIMGVMDDAAGIKTAINYPSAVMGAIFDEDTSTDAAVTAYLSLDNARTAGHSPRAAFWVVGRTIKPGVNFNFGLDMFYHCAIGVCSATDEDTKFNTADIRGQKGDMLDNATVGVWHVTRGSGNLTGLQLEAVTHANLNGWAAANGTVAYCSNCDPAIAGAGPTACTTGGASTGTVAFRLNGAWTCLGI